MAILDNTTAAVTAKGTVEASVTELVKGISQKLRDLIQGGLVSDQRVGEIADEIDADAERLGDAVMANTPYVIEANRRAEADRLQTAEYDVNAEANRRRDAFLADPRPEAVKLNDPHVPAAGMFPVGARPGGTPPYVRPVEADDDPTAQDETTAEMAERVHPTDTVTPNDPPELSRFVEDDRGRMVHPNTPAEKAKAKKAEATEKAAAKKAERADKAAAKKATAKPKAPAKKAAAKKAADAKPATANERAAKIAADQKAADKAEVAKSEADANAAARALK